MIGPAGFMAGPKATHSGDGGENDPLFPEALALIAASKRPPSVAMLQRKLKIGWNRAHRMFEAAGCIPLTTREKQT